MLKFKATCLVVLAGLVLTGCGGSSSTGAENGLRKVSFLLNFAPGGAEAALYYGKAQGLYEAHGIDLEILPGKSSTTTIQQVLNRKADLGTADAKDLLASADKGLRSISVGSRWGESSTGVMVPVDSGITTLGDLEGKTVVSADSSITDLLSGVMRANRADPSKVNFVTVASAQLTTTYATSNQVDAYLGNVASSWPIANEIRPSRIMKLTEHGFEMPGYTYFTSPEFLHENADVVREFLKATYEAMVRASKDPRAAAEAESQAVPGASVDTVLPRFENYLPYLCAEQQNGKSIGYLSPAEWQAGARTLADLGLAEPTLADEVDQLYTNQFVDEPVTDATCPQ